MNHNEYKIDRFLKIGEFNRAIQIFFAIMNFQGGFSKG